MEMSVFPAHAGMNRWVVSLESGGVVCSPLTRG